MNLKTLLLSSLLAFSSLGLSAQSQHDVTEAYIDNAGFDTDFDYAIGATGNVAQEIKEVKGWTKDITVNYTITGVYQIGTAKTFNGAKVPATGFDGLPGGGVLALSTGWEQQMRFYQEVTLPAGTYTLKSAFYNGTDKTLGSSVVGWIPVSGPATMSALASFPANAWTADEVTFTLAEPTKGKIQIGYAASAGGSGNQAKVCLDYVRLFRDTPFGEVDVNLKKEALAADIAAANTLLNGATGAAADVFRVAIGEAQGVYDNPATTIPDVYAAQKKLAEAAEAYSWAVPTGPVPVVVTDKRFARGATMAFGRLNVTGNDIVEQGFCWSTSPDPTIYDNKTTNFINHKGAIYWIQGLTPSTGYYMRAYAVTKGKQVGYGDAIMFYTIPQGRLTYSMRQDGDADARLRIDAAMKAAVGWWNSLTSIQGVNFNVGHNPGTPTADCSYGGYIRVGSNTAYQRTGTMLHEMAHGVGIGTHDPYWNGEMRSNGDRGVWLGDRVTNVIRFWENDETSTVTGDNIHFWPYGINGAHEDDGSDALYIIQSLLIQAFGEDGLPPSGGFASPAYSFSQEEGRKYYLKNESPDYGLYSSYLVENTNGTVELKELTNDEATANDNAAWTVTYEAKNGFYAFKNVGTGNYLTYRAASNMMGTASMSAPGINNLFHLMRSRVNAMEGSSLRGYWIIRNTNVEYPRTMTAESASAVGTATYNLSNAAKSQRWLILTQSELSQLETVAKTAYTQELNDYLAQVRRLRDVPHTEDVPGVDQELDSRMADLESRAAAAATAAEVSHLVKEAKTVGLNFLANATPESVAQPFDLTFMVKSPGMDRTDGWNGTPALAYSSAEFYQTTFDFSQTIGNLPAGCYQLKAQAFQRPGSAAAAYTNYEAGNNNVTAYLYAGAGSAKVAHAVAGAQPAKVGVGNESALSSSPVTYIPNDMQSAGAYFGKSLYDNEVFTDLATDGSSLKIGIRCTSSSSMYWTIFDNFRLYYYGSMKSDVVTSIADIAPATQPETEGVYTIDGRKVRSNASNLDGLPKGIYIVGGRKVVR